MSKTNPVDDLGDELVAAAARRAAGAASHRSSRPRRARPRRALIGVGLVLLVAPATGAAVGIFGLGEGTAPDGSTFVITEAVERPPPGAGHGVRVEADASRLCVTTRFERNGETTTVTRDCRPIDVPTTQPLSVNFAVAPSETVLVSGAVNQRVATLEIDGALAKPQLRPLKNTPERYFAVLVPAKQALSVVARDRDGREVARFSSPPLEEG